MIVDDAPMVLPVVIPRLTPHQTRWKVVRWFKAQGERVSPGEMLLEITDASVSVEVESDVGGVLSGIYAPPGAVLKVGESAGVITLDPPDGTIWPPPPQDAPRSPGDIVLRDEGMTRGVRVARNTVVGFGIFLLAVALLQLASKPMDWQDALMSAGGAVLCFMLVRSVNRAPRGSDTGKERKSGSESLSPRQRLPMFVCGLLLFAVDIADDIVRHHFLSGWLHEVILFVSVLSAVSAGQWRRTRESRRDR